MHYSTDEDTGGDGKILYIFLQFPPLTNKTQRYEFHSNFYCLLEKPLEVHCPSTVGIAFEA